MNNDFLSAQTIFYTNMLVAVNCSSPPVELWTDHFILELLLSAAVISASSWEKGSLSLWKLCSFCSLEGWEVWGLYIGHIHKEMMSIVGKKEI